MQSYFSNDQYLIPFEKVEFLVAASESSNLSVMTGYHDVDGDDKPCLCGREAARFLAEYEAWLKWYGSEVEDMDGIDGDAAAEAAMPVIHPVNDTTPACADERTRNRINMINNLCYDCHDNSLQHGFYGADMRVMQLLFAIQQRLGTNEKQAIEKHRLDMVLTRIALIMSELGEAVEAVRHGNPPSDHIPDFDGLTEELADVFIRVGDLSAYLHLPLGEAIIAKMAFNAGREHLHGKKG